MHLLPWIHRPSAGNKYVLSTQLLNWAASTFHSTFSCLGVLASCFANSCKTLFFWTTLFPARILVWLNSDVLAGDAACESDSSIKTPEDRLMRNPRQRNQLVCWRLLRFLSHPHFSLTPSPREHMRCETCVQLGHDIMHIRNRCNLLIQHISGSRISGHSSVPATSIVTSISLVQGYWHGSMFMSWMNVYESVCMCMQTTLHARVVASVICHVHSIYIYMHLWIIVLQRMLLVYIYVYVYVYTFMHWYVCACVCKCVFVRIYPYIWTHVNKPTHTRTRTHAYIYINMNIQVVPSVGKMSSNSGLLYATSASWDVDL